MNYTYAQMKEMQQQAFERVREMQKKADLTTQQAMRDMANEAEAPASSPQKPPVPQQQKPADRPKHFSMPVEFPNREPPQREAQPNKKASPGNFLFADAGDNESALLLTLVMLLNAENADKELLFALMYIFGQSDH